MSKKTVREMMTPGIVDFTETQLPDLMLMEMFSIAGDLYEQSYFISFQPNGFSKTKVTDGNDNVFMELDFEVPDTIWMITDDHDEFLVRTALLPEEY